MATATLNPNADSGTASISALASAGDQRVEMLGIGWAGYESVLRVRGDASVPKLIYVDGDLLLVSPALPHERLNRRFSFLVDQLILGLRLPCLRSGQTTFRRRGKRGGIEGDHTYYFANEPRVRGKMKIDLRIDPPPDLAIEVVNTHPADTALEVYRRLRVPEVWVSEQGSLDFFVLGSNGRYGKSSHSLAFPFLGSVELLEWMDRPYTGTDVDWMEEVHRWIFKVLVPRARRAGEVGKVSAGDTVSYPVGREDAIALAIRLVEKKHRRSSTLKAANEEENRWVIELLFDPPLPGRREGDTVLVYKKTGVARSIGVR